MNHVGRTTLIALLAIVSSAAIADESARLAKDDVQKTLEGKTMVYTAPNGFAQRVYYSADGRLTARGPGTGKSTQSVGEWKIEDDGKVCIVIKQGPMTDRCYYIVRADNVLNMTYGTKTSVPITFE